MRCCLNWRANSSMSESNVDTGTGAQYAPPPPLTPRSVLSYSSSLQSGEGFSGDGRTPRSSVGAPMYFRSSHIHVSRRLDCCNTTSGSHAAEAWRWTGNGWAEYQPTRSAAAATAVLIGVDGTTASGVNDCCIQFTSYLRPCQQLSADSFPAM